jgi:hypothetical protein
MKVAQRTVIVALLLFVVVTSVIILLAQVWSSSFLIAKDGRTYIFGSSADRLREALCDTGNFKKILHDTRLQDEIKTSMYQYYCVKSLPDKARELYASLSFAQQKELRLSFEKHGFEINKLTC